MSRLVAVLSRRRGTHEWDVVLRATGVLALLAIYPAMHWPRVAGLLGFLCLTLFVSGPISVVVPAAFEPMLMVAGRLYPPLIVALVAVAGNLYMDYVNYHLYSAALQHPRLDRARNSRIVQRLLVLFQRRPFFAVWLCSTLAPLSRYPMRKFLFATFLGRGPRVWFFAALGLVVPVATRTLVTYVVAAITVGIVIATYQRHRAAARSPSPLNEPRLLFGSLPS
jgi:membrane protein YqaA with SNARE-associated domain